MSLLYQSNVTIRTLYRFGGGACAPRRTLVSMAPGSMIVDVPSQKDETDGRRAAWMVAAQAGDRAAYETLLRDCIPFIQRVARGQGVPSDFVDDVVQETLLTIHQARQTYDPSRSFTAGSEPLPSGVRSTGCAAAVGPENAKFISHSLIKVMLIRGGSRASSIPNRSCRSAQFGHRQTPDQAARGAGASCAPGPIAHAGCGGDWTVQGIAPGQLASRPQDLARPIWKGLRSWSASIQMSN